MGHDILHRQGAFGRVAVYYLAGVDITRMGLELIPAGEL
jgi:hypothetical protein